MTHLFHWCQEKTLPEKMPSGNNPPPPPKKKKEKKSPDNCLHEEIPTEKISAEYCSREKSPTVKSELFYQWFYLYH